MGAWVKQHFGTLQTVVLTIKLLFSLDHIPPFQSEAEHAISHLKPEP